MQNIKIIFRHLVRQKLNSTLHIIGLTLGLSVCLLIGLFLRYELSFDNYHQKADRIFRINSSWNNGRNIQRWYSTPLPLADGIRRESTGVENVTMVHPQESVIEVSADKRFNQNNILIVDAEFPDVFDVNVLRGDIHKTLSEAYQAAITQSTARKYFGDEDPIGKTFTFKNEYSITVTSLIEDMPANTHLQASMFLSFVPNEKYLGQGLNSWTSVSGTATYIVAPEKKDFKNLEVQLKFFCEKYIDSEPGLPKNFKSGFELQPLSSIHFDSTYGGSYAVKAVNTSWLWFFAFIGASVLALAGINFINLSTAQAISRAREIGIRKSIGAGRVTLITHFLKEALVLCFGSTIIALAIVQLSLPYLNSILEKGIQFDIFRSPLLILSFLLGILLVSFLAGIYPAWVITRFNPALALKSIITEGGGPVWIRKALVVTQFTISVGLLVALALMSQQVRLLLNRNLGFERDNIINVPIPERSHKTGFLTNELNKIGSVKDFSFATAAPSNWGHWMTEMSLTDKDDSNRKMVTMILADERYSELYSLKLLSGRFNIPTDTNQVRDEQTMKVVVNETLVKTLGFESNDAAIGKRFWCGMNSGRAEIVGVMADFNTASLHEPIPPTFIMPFPNVYSQVGIKLEAYSDLPSAINSIQKAWEKTFAEGVFEFKFLDQQINDFYKSEIRLYTLFKFFAAVAMFISCMGLWGLSTYAAQQRTKEIGIRKVLGASVQSLVSLLSKEFLVMIGLALILASPVAYYFMKDWLKTFAFRIDISWSVFVITGLATTAIALFTVGLQALKAALANPVDSLRSE